MYCLLFYTKMPLFEKSIYNIRSQKITQFYNEGEREAESMEIRYNCMSQHESKIYTYKRPFHFHGAAEESKNTRHHWHPKASPRDENLNGFHRTVICPCSFLQARRLFLAKVSQIRSSGTTETTEGQIFVISWPQS